MNQLEQRRRAISAQLAVFGSRPKVRKTIQKDKKILSPFTQEYFANKPRSIQGRDGIDGRTPTKEEIFSLIQSVVKEPQKPLITEDLVREIVKVMHSLPENDKLEVSKGIRNAQSFLYKGKTYRAEEMMHGGGDTVAAGENITITTVNGVKVISADAGSITVYSETPSGVIDSSNTTYTVLHSISTVLSFGINGQLLQPDTATQTNDFSISGNTITLHSPLDASLSGRPFTIVYIGTTTPPTEDVLVETPTGTVDGSNVTFNVSNQPLYIVVDGEVFFNGFGYTYSSGVITVDSLTPPVQYIRSLYSTGSSVVETPSGLVNGSNLTYTVSNTPLYVVIDGTVYVSGFGYTYLAGTITVDPLIPPASFIRSVFSVGTGGIQTPAQVVDGSNVTFTVSTPKYAIIDNLIRFDTYGYSFSVGTMTVDALIVPTVFVRSIY